MVRRWKEGITLGAALTSEIARRQVSMERAAREMDTSTANLDRWKNKGTVPRGRRAQKVMDWLETDVQGFGTLVASTLLSSSENDAPQ